MHSSIHIWDMPGFSAQYMVTAVLLALVTYFASAYAFRLGCKLFAARSSGEAKRGAGSSSTMKEEHDDA